MKRYTPIIILSALLILAVFILPVSAFSVLEPESHNPTYIHNGSEISAHMKIYYSTGSCGSFSQLIYQTMLENPTWNITICYNENKNTAKTITSKNMAGAIAWFDIYEPNSIVTIDFKITGQYVENGNDVYIFRIYDTIDNSNAIHVYQSDNLNSNTGTQNTQNYNLNTLSSQLTVQENYINEMSNFTDISPLRTQAMEVRTKITQNENRAISQELYSNITNDIDTLTHNVLNYQSYLVENNLKTVSSIIKDTSYYDSFLSIYNKWQSNDYSNNLVTNSYNLYYMAQQDYSNKENMKSSVIILIIVIIAGAIILFLVIRNKNRKKMDEIY